MSILKNIKKAFGFGGDDIESDELFADTTEEVAEVDATMAASPETATAQPLQFDEDMKKRIFDGVITVFNASLPDFLAKSIDAEAQRENLFNALDAGIKEYLSNLASSAEQHSEAHWRARQKSLASDLESVKSRSEEIEKRANDLKQKQLSADRQKRALTERVHELESQLSQLESEREQTDLENRSLLSRIKASAVQMADLEKAGEELLAVREELNRLRANPDAEAIQREEALKAQIAEMEEGMESLKEQLRVSSEMHTDLRRRLSEAENAPKADIAAYDAKIESLTTEVEHLKAELKQCDEIISHVDALEAKLREQVDENAKLNGTLKERNSEITALKKTISENIRLQGERERELQAEIRALRPPTVVSEMRVDFGEPAAESAPRISEAELSAIEESFETDEWFTKTPPAETPSMRPPEAESDFGYKAPRRKQTPPTNPNQLSLF